MLLPRYYYSNDDPELYQYLLTQPHREKHFEAGDYLWKPGELINRVYYIKSGVAVAFVEHENGRKKILLFAGTGSIYPGCHNSRLKCPSWCVLFLLWIRWSFNGKTFTECFR